MAETTVRVYFDSYESAAGGLLMVLLDARKTTREYRFGGLDASVVLMSGLRLEGEIDEIVEQLESLPGAVVQSE